RPRNNRESRLLHNANTGASHHKETRPSVIGGMDVAVLSLADSVSAVASRHECRIQNVTAKPNKVTISGRPVNCGADASNVNAPRIEPHQFDTFGRLVLPSSHHVTAASTAVPKDSPIPSPSANK